MIRSFIRALSINHKKEAQEVQSILSVRGYISCRLNDMLNDLSSHNKKEIINIIKEELDEI